MKNLTWLITGVSSGFGNEMAKQLLERGDTVIGTVRNIQAAAQLLTQYPETFDCRILEMTDVPAIHQVVDDVFSQYGRIDVVVSNAGYGLHGCAEEVSDEEIEHVIATNLVGSIQLIRSALPHLRKQGGGRILQLSSYAGQITHPGYCLYDATKHGIEGFCESVAQEVAPFGIQITLVEPGGARTQFRYGSARIARLMPEYEASHRFLELMDQSKGMAPGDPVRMAQIMIKSVEMEPAPMHLMLGAQALSDTLAVLKKRVADYEAQADIARMADYPDGES